MKKTGKNTATGYITETTFEKHMRSIANSFARVNNALELHGKVLEEILKKIRNIHEDNKYFRESISSLYSDGSSYDRRIEDLTLRVERLESKSG